MCVFFICLSHRKGTAAQDKNAKDLALFFTISIQFAELNIFSRISLLIRTRNSKLSSKWKDFPEDSELYWVS
jgi:hypothetical protein